MENERKVMKMRPKIQSEQFSAERGRGRKIKGAEDQEVARTRKLKKVTKRRIRLIRLLPFQMVSYKLDFT